MSSYEEEDKNAFLRAIQWYRKGLLEESPESKFIFFWSSLEAMAHTKDIENKSLPILCKNCGKKVSKVKYYAVEDMKILTKEEFSNLMNIRSSIVHGGSAPQKITDANKKIEEILRKLKIQSFGLVPSFLFSGTS